MRAIRVSSPLKSLREAAGLSQTDLVRLSGIAQSKISAIENSTEPNLTLATAHRLARALNCTLDDLFPLDPEPVPAPAGEPAR